MYNRFPMEDYVDSLQSWVGRHKFWTAVLIGLGSLLLLFAVMHFLPVTVDSTAVPNPAGSYEEAAERIEAVQAQERESGIINPVCESRLMTHDQKTEKAIVFYHGFTSCPEQFSELGQRFYDDGYNVYIPRLPHHGHSDRDRSALQETSAEELASFALETVDIAEGLGDRVVVGGLSGGGTIAAWVAQQYDNVDRAIIMAPFLGIGFIPAPLNRSLARIIDDIPNINMWWDPGTKENNPLTAPYAYPGYPLHALAEYLRLGFATQDLARKEKPAVDSISVISNEHDNSVNNGITRQLIGAWQGHGESGLDLYDFAAVLGLPHDLITPTREDGNPGLVYPVIIESIEQ